MEVLGLVVSASHVGDLIKPEGPEWFCILVLFFSLAPEIVNYEPLSKATDMWAVGVVTYIL